MEDRHQKLYFGLAIGFFTTVGLISFTAFSRTSTSFSSFIRSSEQSTNGSHGKKGQSSRPNIVFILADDMGWNSIGYEEYDLSFVSPRITSLANEGLIMNNYYAQEVCTPSRASLLTGRYPLTVGMQYGVVTTNTPWGLNLDETTLAEVLKNNGYDTHMIGKWHLGHHSPRYLPTARGFDTFTGYLDGDNYYFSKKNPTKSLFYDFMSSDADCYYTYDNNDMHNYSTHFYRDLAQLTIQRHDQSNPLFLYVAFQAVHDPFQDIYEDREVVSSFLRPGTYDEINATVTGTKRQQYAMALGVLDKAVEDIVDTLTDVGMIDNTYVIFASDNGGCFLGGGKNGPLKGTKATLFEGGTKVDSFVYSPLLSSELVGSYYTNLMHVSDWFPTILDMAGVTYAAPTGFALDGFSHYTAWSNNSIIPREYMLYNDYFNVEGSDFSLWDNQTFAIRNARYKLLHGYNESMYSNWFSYDEVLHDDTFEEACCLECFVQAASEGPFYYALYDIQNDPYETTNLYDSSDDDIINIKNVLYEKLTEYEMNSAPDISGMQAENLAAEVTWKDAGNYIVPFASGDHVGSSKSYPGYCGASSSIVDDDGAMGN